MKLDYATIDVDNHYYETIDSCTRYLPREFKERGVRFVDKPESKHGGKMCIIGGRVSWFTPNPTFNPIGKPGCILDFFNGQAPSGTEIKDILEIETLRKEYQDRDARLTLMDKQGLQAVVLFPTFACGVEEALSHDVEAVQATMEAFNLWMEDDWGYDYQERIFAAPVLSLAMIGRAEKELDRVLAKGARVVSIRPGPALSENGGSRRPIGGKEFDGIWARLSEANVPVGFHLSDSGYQRYAADWGDAPNFESFLGEKNNFGLISLKDRPIGDTISSLVFHGALERHPGLKVMSVENGADEWLPLTIKKMKKQYHQWGTKRFKKDVMDIFRSQVYVSPYPEDDIKEIVELIGEDQVLFGSDFPHPESTPVPNDFVNLLDGLEAPTVRKIMRDNAAGLLKLS